GDQRTRKPAHTGRSLSRSLALLSLCPTLWVHVINAGRGRAHCAASSAAELAWIDRPPPSNISRTTCSIQSGHGLVPCPTGLGSPEAVPQPAYDPPRCSGSPRAPI